MPPLRLSVDLIEECIETLETTPVSTPHYEGIIRVIQVLYAVRREVRNAEQRRDYSEARRGQTKNRRRN